MHLIFTVNLCRNNTAKIIFKYKGWHIEVLKFILFWIKCRVKHLPFSKVYGNEWNFPIKKNKRILISKIAKILTGWIWIPILQA